VEAIALLADSSPQGRQLGAQALRDCGWRVIAATSGDEALEQLRTHSVAMIVADAKLAGIGGAELARRVHANPDWAAVPVLLTHGALDSPSDAERAAANGVVRKPLSVAALQPWIERWMPELSQAATAAPANAPDTALEWLHLALREAVKP